MDKDLLVGDAEAVGSTLLEALDEQGVAPEVAMWLWSREQERWWYVLAGGDLDGLSQKAAFEAVHTALVELDFAIAIDEIAIFRTSDPTIQAMSVFVVDGGPVRMSGNVVNGVALPPAVVYRLRLEPKASTARKEEIRPSSRTGGVASRSKKSNSRKSRPKNDSL